MYALKIPHVFQLSFIIFFIFFNASPIFSQEGEFFVTTVEKVLSGNRVLLRGGAIVEYAGIDVPDVWHSQPAMRNFGKQALAFNTQLVSEKKIRFEFVDPESVGESETGPRQAYVFSSGAMINGRLLKAGLGMIKNTYPKDQQYYPYFYQLQKGAMQKRVGIWKAFSSK